MTKKVTTDEIYKAVEDVYKNINRPYIMYVSHSLNKAIDNAIRQDAIDKGVFDNVGITIDKPEAIIKINN